MDVPQNEITAAIGNGIRQLTISHFNTLWNVIGIGFRFFLARGWQ